MWHHMSLKADKIVSVVTLTSEEHHRWILVR